MWIRIAHAGIEGESYVTQEAFDAKWEALGWFEIPPGEPTPVVPPYVPYREKGQPLGVATLDINGVLAQGGGGGGGAPTGAAGGVLAGTYPNPSFASDMATQTELGDAVTAIGVTTTALDARLDAIEAWQATIPAVADIAVFSGSASTRRLDVPQSTGDPGNPAAGKFRIWGLTTDKSGRVRNDAGAETFAVPGWDSPSAWSSGPFTRANQTLTEILTVPIVEGRYTAAIRFTYEASTVGDLAVKCTVPAGASFHWSAVDDPASTVNFAELGSTQVFPGAGAAVLRTINITGQVVIGAGEDGDLGLWIARNTSDAVESVVTDVSLDLYRQQ